MIADTAAAFASFGLFLGSQPPALNNDGGVAFLADLDAGGLAILVGPDPVADRIIGTGDTLDGSTVTNLRICDEASTTRASWRFRRRSTLPATERDPRGRLPRDACVVASYVVTAPSLAASQVPIR